MASDDAMAQLKNKDMHHLTPVGEPMHMIDARPGNLAVERNGSDVTAATRKNRDVASLDAPKIVDDEHVRHPGPVENTAHQEDAPHVNKRKGLVIGRGIANETSITKDERQETFIQAVVCENDAPVPNGKRNECPEASTQSAASARSAPAFHVEQVKNFVIGQGVGRNNGIEGNERQQTFARDVASADCTLVPCHPLPESNNVERKIQLIVGRASVNETGVKGNEHLLMFAQDIASAENALACRPSPPTLHNDAKLMRELVIGRASTRGSGNRRNERQRMSIHTVAGAIGAPARCRSLRMSNNLEETYSLTNEVSKQRAASSTLPTVTQTSHLPPLQVQTSSKARQDPSRGHPPSVTSSSPSPIDNLVIGRGKARNGSVGMNERPLMFV
jgi:hypothetical protein